MNKSEIRKKILKIRQKNSIETQQVDIKPILKILKRNKSIKKVVGGYYPYNSEIDAIKILEKLEKTSVLEITEPIQLQNAILILKLNDKKKIETSSINLDEELRELIKFETNTNTSERDVFARTNVLGFTPGYWTSFDYQPELPIVNH